ncbi:MULTISPECIES: flagellin [unclassified Aminobacter]|uniref:flagellin N-terminal helical domain-containing protein n=1 Tax=unclassified Aminobacter TaxID=2644704 RepID=UPI000467A120|nr:MULTISPECIES: flagellin [unclassified Aminobacter]TWG49362.1 flagellin [Aminobacter sp. J44]TWH23411.1 flagellin [Aminobacter sp. J15]
MSSLNTNAAAMTALQTLSATNKNLATVQNRISTGFRVSEAKDNAAYWSIATTMRSDNKANSVLQDNLGLGAGKVDVAYTAMNKAIEIVDQIKEKVLMAKTASAEDRAKIQSEISTYIAQLEDNISGANYAGSNILKTNSGTANAKLTILSSYTRDAGGAVTTGKIEIALSNVRLLDTNATPAGILDGTNTTSNIALTALNVTNLAGVSGGDEATQFDNLLTHVEKVLADLSTGASELGAAKKRIDMQMEFVSALQDAIDRGVGQLVDADMEKESAKLSALQVQQQLGIQALSIANSNSQNILALFKN